MVRASFPILVSVALAGCGQPIAAPSLDVRPIEQRPIAPPDDAREAEAPADPSLPPRIAAIVAQAEEGDRRFQAQRPQVAAAQARAHGASEGSEAWIVAQQALSTLNAAQGAVGDAAAALDALRSEPANAAAPNRAAIDQAAARIETIAESERAAIPER